jgi:uncharacterized protein (TIGR00730 family)
MILCIYCGTGSGVDPAYLEAAKATATLFAQEGIEIVYGGAIVGLMGAVADAALAAGGKVIGVMPQALIEREIAPTGLTEMHVTQGMHERKALMEQLSTGFVALPGGPGTLDEMIEQWTWGVLGIHTKPCGFLNVRGYFDPLRAMIQRMVDQGFVQQAHADMLVFTDDPAELLRRFRTYLAPPPKWGSPAGV